MSKPHDPPNAKPRAVWVAICTWNGCRCLAKTLEPLTIFVIADRWKRELIVVINTEDTGVVIANVPGHLPIRRVSEPTPGLAHARNLANRMKTTSSFPLCAFVGRSSSIVAYGTDKRPLRLSSPSSDV